jgi:hypothetical protein
MTTVGFVQFHNRWFAHGTSMGLFARVTFPIDVSGDGKERMKGIRVTVAPTGRTKLTCPGESIVSSHARIQFAPFCTLWSLTSC